VIEILPADAGEGIFELAEAMFEDEAAAPIGAADRVHIGLAEGLIGRLAFALRAVLGNQIDIRLVSWGDFGVVPRCEI
jgi:hypothetical protein